MQLWIVDCPLDCPGQQAADNVAAERWSPSPACDSGWHVVAFVAKEVRIRLGHCITARRSRATFIKLLLCSYRTVEITVSLPVAWRSLRYPELSRHGVRCRRDRHRRIRANRKACRAVRPGGLRG